MNLEELRQALVMAARHAQGDASVPDGFERRVTRAVLAHPREEPWLAWLQGLRRAAFLAASIAAVTLMLHLLAPARTTTVPDVAADGDPLGDALIADVSGLLEESLGEESAP